MVKKGGQSPSFFSFKLLSFSFNRISSDSKVLKTLGFSLVLLDNFLDKTTF